MAFSRQEGFLYCSNVLNTKEDEYPFLEKFVAEEFTLFLKVNIPSTVVSNSVELTFRDLIDPFWMVASLVVEEGVANCAFYIIQASLSASVTWVKEIPNELVLQCRRNSSTLSIKPSQMITMSSM